MNIYPFVFSNKPSYRLARHSTFWISWILYYAVFSAMEYKGDVPGVNKFFGAFTEIAISTPLDMIYCYSIIYFLIPNVLFKGRYISMVLLWLLFSIIFIVLFEAYVLSIVPHIRGWYGLEKPMKPMSYTWVFFSLFSQINMEGCLAAAIKLGKQAFIKQQEVDLLKKEKEKIAEEDKTGMQPVFLIGILNKMKHIAPLKPHAIHDMMERMRNLLLYAFYENTQTKVPLQKEFYLLHEYIELEKNLLENDIQIEVRLIEPAEEEVISPLILLPVIENVFKQAMLYEGTGKKIGINAQVNNSVLEMKLTWCKPPDTSTLAEGRNKMLRNISKRLNLFYPEGNRMKLTIGVNTVTLLIEIHLKTAVT
jgi:hypothetical protein